MGFTKYIIVISHLPIAIAFLYAAFIFKSLSKELKCFSIFLSVSFVIQFTSLYLWYRGVNNFFLLHIYVPAGFTSLALFYQSIIRIYVNKMVIVNTIILFVTYSVFNSAFIQAPDSFNSYALTTEAVLILILSLSTFILLLNDSVKENRKELLKSIYWINSGLFIYYSSTLIIFYYGDYLTRNFSAELNRYTWVMHSFFSVIMYVCFIYGIWYRPKN